MSPIPELVTLEQAKRHLRLSPPESPLSEEDEDVALKLAAATEIVLDYLERDDEDWLETMSRWTPETVPKAIHAAVLLQTGHLYRFRGDDVGVDEPKQAHGFLASGVTNLLHRWRDPVVG